MAAASPTLTALLLLVVVVFTATGAAAAAAALDDVCNGLGRFNVTPELCTSILCADASAPCRAAGDPPAVAALATKVASQNAADTKGRLETALSASPGNEGLRACLDLYAAAVPALEWAAGQLRGAREVLKAAEYAAEACEGMAGAGALPGENSAFVNVARVGQAVLSSMIRD
ncbi:hypothetical protein PR202_gb24141 [Eleusine coracana subsp. coracana]|uniref:Pectinesterase inhibitor domain-containing protein n=1 Tax=Eleusine coracana subsp. coracana TaxID=191504 RepID=A0AAV5FKA1_ELECO|nr:hypothetical protein QOZ80_5BG0444970 [Eleusine coracana subsp. coracana]GJN35372.1 hypothetical protein PR202_gb24141 [Eleusine coracana subsp. coracana]